MRISGLAKLTLLDFPGKVACTIFTEGCNLRCPFCHNALLVTDTQNNEHYTEEDIFEFLTKRKNVLEGVAITGGEPLLQKDIGEFIANVKQMGFAVKLDTNGTFPDKLKELIDNKLVDYVAMDVKNSKEMYEATVGARVNLDDIEKSIEVLKQGNVPYELRTTVTATFHNDETMESLAKWIAGADRYFLQQFVNSGNLIDDSVEGASEEDMKRYKQIVSKYVPNVSLRGINE